MPRRQANLPVPFDDELIENAGNDVELKLQELAKLQEEFKVLMNQHKMRSAGIIYGYFGWDFKFSTSIKIR
jgi:hypothetical protein